MKKNIIAAAVFLALTITGCSTATDQSAQKGSGYTGQIVVREDYPGQIAGQQAAYPTDTTGRSAITGKAAGYTANRISANNADALGDGIVVLNITTPAQLGKTGSLSIQGKPDTLYTVTAVYNQSGKAITATSTKRSLADGRCNWSWDVNPATTPGTYNISIEGGGEQSTAAYTVTQ